MKHCYSQDTITIIGGDFRHFLLYRHFSKLGFSVTGFGLSSSTTTCPSYSNYTLSPKNLSPSDIWVAGIPFSKDDTYLYGDTLGNSISLEAFFQFLNENPPKRLIAGHFSQHALELARKYQIPCTDLLQFDSLTIANAVPTAEGAIFHAMRESPNMLHNSDCLVLGYGKCGKILANKLKGLDAIVTICARKKTDRITAHSMGFQTIPLDQLTTSLSKFLFIFNTIPAKILDRQALSFLQDETVVIDIASTPGGVDYEAAKELHKATFHCLSLPGKIAPNAAANILFQEILQFLTPNEYTLTP